MTDLPATQKPVDLKAVLSGTSPTVATFADRSSGPKQLGPVLTALEVAAADVLYVGDTAHDRACARAVGCRFAHRQARAAIP